jgi:large subunit ribosomal protein L6
MSRIGKQIIKVPAGVTVTIGERELEVKGPKGTLRTPIPEGVTFNLEEGQLQAVRASDDFRANHGLARALANNAVVGVTEGFTKQMDVVGVGYKADVQGRKIVFSLGYSHPIEFPLPEGIDVKGERVATKASIQQYQLTLTLTGRGDARPTPPRPLQGQGRALLGRAVEAEARQDRKVVFKF